MTAEITVHHGDCLDVLVGMPDASVDAVVTDPPYLLGFMGRDWDSRGAHEHLAWHGAWAAQCLRVLKPGGHLLAFGGTRTWHRLACAIEDAGFEVRDSIAWLYASGFPKSLDVSKAIDKAAGATREPVPNPRAAQQTASAGRGETVHVEGGDYGHVTHITPHPATPAAQQWAGWGTALKPAFEPIVVARKPLQGTVASNVLAWGCGAINVGACRVGSTGSGPEGSGGQARARECPVHRVHDLRQDSASGAITGGAAEVADDLWPEVHGQADERAAEPELVGGVLDGQPRRLQIRPDERAARRGQGPAAAAAAERGPGAPAGNGAEDRAPAAVDRDGAPHQRREGGQPAGEFAPHGLGRAQPGAPADRAGAVGASSGERPTPGCTCGTSGVTAGRWPTNVVLDGDAADELDEQSGITKSTPVGFTDSAAQNTYNAATPSRAFKNRDHRGNGYTDYGGASRFFPVFRYQAKAPTRERVKVDGIAHPTVKPLALMRWLVRLVTPPGGVVLDPFAGSGTTGEACLLEGFSGVLIEQDADYLPLIHARIARQRDRSEPLSLFDLAEEF